MEILKLNTSEADWIAVGKNISLKRESSAFELGDWINFGVKTYGKVAAYRQAATVIRRSRSALYLFSRTARTFAPERRVPELHFVHHAVLVKYPPTIVDELLREAVAKDWTCKQLRAAAEERCGVRKANTKRVPIMLRLQVESVTRLKELAEGKQVTGFVVKIVEDWLRENGHADAVAATPTTAERRQGWEAEKKCISCGSKPADEGSRKCAECRAKNNEWQKWNATERQEPPATPEAVLEEVVQVHNDVAAPPEPPRPTYAERREQQLAAGAAPIPPKLHRHSTKPKKCACKIRAQWTTECRPHSFIEDAEGNVSRFKDTRQPSCFKTEEAAIKANELYRTCHGYAEQVVYCEPCRAWHLKHVYYVDSIARGVPVEQAVVGQRAVGWGPYSQPRVTGG